MVTISGSGTAQPCRFQHRFDLVAPSHLLRTDPAEWEHFDPFDATARLESADVRGALYEGLAVVQAANIDLVLEMVMA